MEESTRPTPHRTELRVRYGETDQMGVVHHAVYISYFELARTDMMRCHGLSYAEMERRGTLLAVVDVGLRYLAPAHFDDVLIVETRLAEAGRVKVRFDYRVLREASSGPTTLCTGHTVLACVSPNLTPQRIAEQDRKLMQGLVAGSA